MGAGASVQPYGPSMGDGISQTCYRYRAKLDAENAVVADWLVRLTNKRNWGFGPCFSLRNVKGFKWNYKRSLPDLSRAGTELADKATTSPGAGTTAAAGRACRSMTPGRWTSCDHR